MIVNVRGTNGSGKSTVVRKFLTDYPMKERYGVLGPRRPEAYMVDLWLDHQIREPLFVIGPYQNVTGGVDSLGLPLEGLTKLLGKYSAQGHVLLEGVIISTIFGTLGKWLADSPKNVSVFYLDTPLAECLRSLGVRGANRGTAHVESKIKAIVRTKDFMDEAGIYTATVSRDTAFEAIRARLK